LASDKARRNRAAQTPWLSRFVMPCHPTLDIFESDRIADDLPTPP
jgi:hypothetical protein